MASVFRIEATYKRTEKGKKKRIILYTTHHADSGIGLLEHVSNTLFADSKKGRTFTAVLSEKKFVLNKVERIEEKYINDIHSSLNMDIAASKENKLTVINNLN